MESNAVKSLMQLKGLGAASARRLVAAGIDDFAKLAAAGEEQLRAIRGLNPRSVPLILEAAAARAALDDTAGGKEAEAGRLVEIAHRLQEMVGQFAALLEVAQEEQPGKKTAGRLQKEITRVQTLLEQIVAGLPGRMKKRGKALVKSDRRLAELSASSPKRIAKGLKKTRKTLKKALG
jgi:tRNA A37 threonylcarbamoyladenosine synthetase subunit TsaC/SUA5/YrdC